MEQILIVFGEMDVRIGKGSEKSSQKRKTGMVSDASHLCSCGDTKEFHGKCSDI